MTDQAALTITALEEDEESSVPAVSWGAIFAGAFVGLGVSVALFTLGSGLGFSAISPWPNTGVSGTTFGVSAAVWLILVQWVAAAFAGYIAARLRTKWTGVHTDEVFFRDTAHGFVAWAVGTAAMAALLSVGIASAVGGATQAVAHVAAGAAQGATQATAQAAGNGGADQLGYFTDTLFRAPPGAAAPAAPAGGAAGPDPRAESGRILTVDLLRGDIPQADHDYLVQLVAARTGLSQADAQKRVDDVIAQAKAAADKVKQAADAARKAAATFAIFLFFSFLIGAFIASVAAAIGGRAREAAEMRVRA
jgi:hypothetical protein